MIDIEHEVFNFVATSVRTAYPSVYMTGEYVKTPPKFPCVSLVEMDNSADEATQTSGEIENHAVLLYQVDVYSNKSSGKKAECKALSSIVDKKLAEIGFTRTMLQPIPNMDDATIYRMTGRYRAVVSKENVIYRK